MALKDIPIAELTIDEQFAEDGEYLGIMEIANTANPAIQVKGVAFSKHESKELFFKDELKYRIAAPVLMPSDIYRVDEQTGEEYYLRVKPEVVEAIFVKFMKDRAGQDIFNVEHDESKRVPSYILETWLVEKPLEDKAYTTYGIEVPEKTWFAVQQFTDAKAYQEAVKNDLTGFSIHGNGALQFAILKQKIKMKKRKFVARMSEMENADSGEIIVSTDGELVQGAEVVVIDENLQPVEGFTGEVVIEDETLKIENDVITEVVSAEPVEAAEEEKVEMTEGVKEEEVEMATEEEVTEDVSEAKVEMMTEEEILSVIQPKIDEIYEMIAEVKAMNVQAAEVKEDEATVQMSKADVIMMNAAKISQVTNKNRK